MLESVPSALNVKLVACICKCRKAFEGGCNYLNEEEVRWGCIGSALKVRSFAYVKCTGVHWECAGGAFIRTSGMRWSCDMCVLPHENNL